MTTECARIADQLRRAFEGQAWHGPLLKELLADVSADQAAARPIAGVHSIWELVSHIEVWTRAAFQAIKGVPMPNIVGTAEDWPSSPASTAEAWSAAKQQLLATGGALASAIEGFADNRLTEIVPGRPQYDFYFLFHGVVQHSLYHAGQIALAKKALASR
jgi:uncharacterized damage-inducible protein DinB